MVQNRNLGLLLEKLFDDEQILERILLANDMHELYVICLTIQDGYSYEEFEEFFCCLVSGCIEDLKYINEMSPEDLENVSGGRGEFNKAASAALASFLALTSVSAHSENMDMPSISDAYQSAISISANKDHDEDEENDAVTEMDGHLLRKKVAIQEEEQDDEGQKEKEGIGGFLSRKLKSIGETIKNNKGKIFVSAALMALTAGAFYATKDKPWGFNKQVEQLEKERIAEKGLETEKQAAERKLKAALDAAAKAVSKEEGEGGKEEEGGVTTNDDIKAAREELARVESKIAKMMSKNVFSKIADFMPAVLVVGGGMLRGGVKGVINTVHSLTKWGGDVSKNITDMQKLVGKFLPSWILGYDNITDYDYEDNKNLTPEERIANLKRDLELLKGQREAKKQIIKFLAIIENARRRWEEGIWQKTGANFLVFNGPSGTGKTFAASILAKNISTIKPYIITADEILRNIRDGEAMWGRRPSITQVLLSAEHKNQDGSVDNFPNSLGAYVNKYGDQGMVLIDEFDKLMINLSREERRALEEFFRTLMDSGIVKSQYGETYDLRGMTIVLTTNETTASLEGRIIERPDGSFVEMIKDADGNVQYITPVQDETGTQTLVAHDPSFTQRLRGSICTFNSLTIEDFEEIARYYLGDDLTKTKDDVIAEGGTPCVTLGERVCWEFDSVEISDESYRLIAEFAARQPNAVRSIVGVGSQAGSVAGNYREALVDKLTAIRAEGGDIEKAKFEAIAHAAIDAAGNPVIEFEIKFLGYADEQQEENLVKFDPTFAQEYKASDNKTGVLNEADYEQILKHYLGDDKQITKEEVTKQGGTPCVTVGERLTEGFDSVKISDESYKLLADYVAKQKNGIESIVGTDEKAKSLVNSYHTALKKEIESLKKIGKDVQNAKFEAIACENIDEKGNSTIDFGIKFLGYAGDEEITPEDNKASEGETTPEDNKASEGETTPEGNKLSDDKNDLVKFDPTFAREYKASDNKTGVLNEADYEQILKYYLDDNKQITKEEVIKQGGTPCVTVGERLSEGFDSVKISDESYKLLADYVAKQKNGIESIVGTDENSKSLVNNYYSALKKGIADFKEQGEDIQNAEFEVVPHEKMFDDNRLGIEFELRLLNRLPNDNNAY